MATVALVGDWNANIAFKIRESDLSHPTEEFLVRALLSLLEALSIRDQWSHLVRFHLDFTIFIASFLQISSKNKHHSQIGKAHFVKFVNDLYTISYPRDAFAYFDLIQPAPKKVYQLLNALLNYFHYYGMMKEEVRNRVVPLLEKHDELQTRVNQLTIEQERRKMTAENVRPNWEADFFYQDFFPEHQTDSATQGGYCSSSKRKNQPRIKAHR